MPILAATPAQESNTALVVNHEYTIEAYDPSTGTVTLRNPYGHSLQTADQDMLLNGQTLNGVTSLGGGLISLSLNTFKTFFQSVTVASKD